MVVEEGRLNASICIIKRDGWRCWAVTSASVELFFLTSVLSELVKLDILFLHLRRAGADYYAPTHRLLRTAADDDLRSVSIDSGGASIPMFRPITQTLTSAVRLSSLSFKRQMLTTVNDHWPVA